VGRGREIARAIESGDSWIANYGTVRGMGENMENSKSGGESRGVNVINESF